MEQTLEPLGASGRLLSSCIADLRAGSFILYASEALFAFDYCLTIADEVRHVWMTSKRRGPSALSSLPLFCVARYLGLASCIISLLPSTVSISAAVTCIRMATIISSELILGVRTWVIWNRTWWVSCVLLATGTTAIALAAATVHRDIATTSLSTSASPQQNLPAECQIVQSTVGAGWMLPYILTILFETVTATLTFSRVLWWRMRMPQSPRVPLLDTLWRDGVLYFFFMMGVGIINVIFVASSTSPQARLSFSQLQTVLHSMLSTRSMLHLASSGTSLQSTRVDRSVVTGAVQFTSVFALESRDWQDSRDS